MYCLRLKAAKLVTALMPQAASHVNMECTSFHRTTAVWLAQLLAITKIRPPNNALPATQAAKPATALLPQAVSHVKPEHTSFHRTTAVWLAQLLATIKIRLASSV